MRWARCGSWRYRATDEGCQSASSLEEFVNLNILYDCEVVDDERMICRLIHVAVVGRTYRSVFPLDLPGRLLRIGRTQDFISFNK